MSRMTAWWRYLHPIRRNDAVAVKAGLSKNIRCTGHADHGRFLSAFQLESGMTDHLLRIAMEEGIDPVETTGW